MPISMDEWNKGRDDSSTDSKVDNFLSSNIGKAFSLLEIVENVYPASDDLSGTLRTLLYLPVVRITLERLIKEGRVKAKLVKKEIGHDTYYTKA